MLTNYRRKPARIWRTVSPPLESSVPDGAFYTSAMATADFLRRQGRGKKAYVVGKALIPELYKAGFTITDVNPDFVIVGKLAPLTGK